MIQKLWVDGPIISYVKISVDTLDVASGGSSGPIFQIGPKRINNFQGLASFSDNKCF